VNGYVVANKFTLVEDAVVRSLNVLLYDATAGTTFRMALYADDGGAPSRPAGIIAESAATSAATGWNTADIADTALSAGDYWIAIQAEAGIGVSADINGPADSGIWNVYATYTAFPATFPVSGTLWDVVFSVYADY